nr:MAG TPA: Nucleotide modification associated domain 1 [Crassvirales sp.]
METTVNKEYQKLIDTIKSVRDMASLSPEMCARLKTVEQGLINLGSSPVLSDKVQSFMDITTNMAKTYAAKNHDYGNSFEQSCDKFGIIASVVRLGDKMNRIESLTTKEAEVKEESIKDTLLDLANYAIMTVMWLNQQPKEE